MSVGLRHIQRRRAIRIDAAIAQFAPDQEGVHRPEHGGGANPGEKQQGGDRQSRSIGQHGAHQRAQRIADFFGERDVAYAMRGVRIMFRLYRAHDVFGEKLQDEQRDNAKQEPARDDHAGCSDKGTECGCIGLGETVDRPFHPDIKRRTAGKKNAERYQGGLEQDAEDRPVAELA